MEIRSLVQTDFDTIFKAFGKAFADYEMQLDKTQLAAMLQRRGFDPRLSFAAFDKGEITAFTLNGTGDYNGIPTAYDTGTGTLPDHRGKGLATAIFEHSIPFLKGAGIRQYLLEVLQHNDKAVSVYRKLGFGVTREFNYFGQKTSQVNNDITTGEFSLERIDIPIQEEVEGFWDFYPSWQNSLESVRRSSDAFICLGAFTENELAGYCIFEPVSGDITQIAVGPGYRRRGIASSLLREKTALNKNDSIKVINADISCGSITCFLRSKNIDLKGKQFEMIKQL